ncbi:hypothetical protein DUNSADRAFT_9741 [Dunaliella salina]|uniref:Uncharacterized protein n=1 Tax=Dunaliella salina TaxID=3046 RepID=A0ABQ7GGW4_DUNSA|nr:hypothetical protein DUNSADRAFT_9741 [Dunaliella salina]|eukprot:KAF5833832.1 hypothetical protein DUNSADRAFT_9741 [Dunaliella salina]
MAAEGLLLVAADHAGAVVLFWLAAGHADVVRLLCNRDADINCPMRPSRSLQVLLGAHAGATPLHLAADQGNVSVVLVILKYFLEQQMLSNTSVADPRSVRDSTGMRPHQVAFLTHNFRTAMLLRPGYPLTWLFRTTRVAPAPAIPSLAALAARALRAKVCSQVCTVLQSFSVSSECA